ncbi:MAG TPA: transcription antitermination factor NusB [Geminicoccus sp.]|jgi:N utilization substance protein B|uniref:transcription antitermination factor NusB n=1 Tax=Geminicoccus sp. TaxID=2024832 RepID=UPI002E305F9D|nr:transcription antitermination factor NusB [Geminicoccus sp.]HEX2525051.1 transcription antitermination factor NusB [Geminicoccus sp.]
MTRKKTSKPITKRRAARFAAIQALYQIELMGARPSMVVHEFDDHRLSELFEPFLPDEPAPDVDREWFRLVVTGAAEETARLDGDIAPLLATGWTMERLSAPMRALLRCAAYELAYRHDVPPNVVVDEYVELAYAFFEGGEPGFVNAILDRLSRDMRRDVPTV